MYITKPIRERNYMFAGIDRSKYFIIKMITSFLLSVELKKSFLSSVIFITYLQIKVNGVLLYFWVEGWLKLLSGALNRIGFLIHFIFKLHSTAYIKCLGIKKFCHMCFLVIVRIFISNIWENWYPSLLN